MQSREEIDKRKFILAVDWFWKYKKGKSIRAFFEENGYSRIIIYGMGVLGELLQDEIPEYVAVCFDRKGKSNMYGNIVDIKDIDKFKISLNDSDLVVITLMDLDRKIESDFYKRGFQGDVLNLYDIVEFYS